jgi:hypothetical protein
MGVQDRDWYREEPPARARPRALSALAIAVAVLAGLGLAAVVLGQLEPAPASYGGKHETRSDGTRIQLLPGLGFTVGRDGLYDRDDPWRAYLADERTCPGGDRTDTPPAVQAETMVCLVNHARAVRRLEQLATVAPLNRASLAKADRIVRCRDFDHDACGRDAAEDARAAGHTAAWGENLYIAEGRFGAPRVALDRWLNSPGHRENLFRPEWRTHGLAVLKLDTFATERDVTLWVHQLGPA